jgi:hypothetical protein
MKTGPNVLGGYPTRGSQVLETAAFTATGLNPQASRALVFFHPERKLAKVLRDRGDEDAPLTVRLEPLGALSGRILDAEGRPRAGLNVAAMPGHGERQYEKFLGETMLGGLPRSWQELTTRQTTTDKDGRFRLDGLTPGLPYRLQASEGDLKEFAPVCCQRDGLSVGADKVTDLGDLKSESAPGKRQKDGPD